MKPEESRTAPRSMSHLLRLALILVGLVAVVLTSVGAAFLFHRAFAAQVDRDLARTARALAAGYEADPGYSVLEEAVSGSTLRLTLVDTDGTVLYDTVEPADRMENHASRPEIAAARQSGEGSSVRQSTTLGREVHYYALLLQSGQVLRLAEETSTMWSLYNQVLPLLGAGCVLVVLVSALLAAAMTRCLVRPITRMADHLDTIEANVPYEELIPLAHTIQSDRRLRENNETMRREFTANVSHELKTPLTSISGYAELIETGMAKPEDVPVFGQRIHKEAGRMIRLVSDILQLSELDGMHSEGSTLSEPLPVDLASLLKEVNGNMTMNARKAYVTLQCDPGPATVLGSRDLLTELVTNLCDNAIRYNRPGGHVTLRSGTDGTGAPYVSVEDNGIGIPQDAQSRVFERFYRVDKSRSKATGGTGLGLAIVKHIAVLHGARIDLRSTVGTGTTIRVTFPAPKNK
ncbi:sensor histidine kinase [Gemmiger formicilis]|uniref:sensor histidine kinase n=1 Tax=Gemmiger formicilis TaxID=745368 RepID=UPI001FAF80B1|nr:ATP-binding protein [Gemmiger formicilis]